MGDVLFIGNGINKLESTLSWEDLISKLADFIGKTGVFSLQKPFPILYEEIMLRGLKYSKINESELKSKVAELALDLPTNDIHSRIFDLSISDVITTNYDYCIEESHFKVTSKNYGVYILKRKETDYRLHTYIHNNNKRFWHIHGEALYPRTIVLGHDMYSRVLNKYIEYTDKHDILGGNVNSWIDLFFTSNIHMLGLACDYTEIDIWWLLNCRARKMLSGENINNKIIYHSFIDPKATEEKKADFSKKKELLFAHQVRVKEYKASSYREFYEKVYSEIG